MFEATRDFLRDAACGDLETPLMLDVLKAMLRLDDPMPFGQAINQFHWLAPRERNYICRVLLEYDQDPVGWMLEYTDAMTQDF